MEFGIRGQYQNMKEDRETRATTTYNKCNEEA